MLQQAAMSCNGSTVPTIAISTMYLRSFQSKFTGVTIAPSCKSKLTAQYSCLISICSGSLVLQGSMVSLVQGLPLRGLVCVVHDSRLELSDSLFANNHVRPLIIGEQASVVLHHSSAFDNVVDRSGGAMWVEGNASLTITSTSRVRGNSANFGGGGLCVVGNARVVIDGGSVISNNTAASDGGGLQAEGNARVTLTDGCIVQGNRASRGGGLFVAGDAEVAIAGGSVIDGNIVASIGGGLFVGATASIEISGGSRVRGNIANMHSGGVYVTEGANVTITDSSVHGNVAHDGGGGMLVQGTSKVAIINSSIHSNIGRRDGDKKCGGGLYLAGYAAVDITNNSRVCNNSVSGGGGGICAGENATLAIMQHSIITHNRALNGSGGGLMLWDNAVMNVSNGCIIANNSCAYGAGGGISVGINLDEFKFGGLGRLEHDSRLMQNNFTTHVRISGSTVANNTSNNGAGGGLAVASRCIVSLSGTNVSGNRVTGGSGGAVMLTDHALLNADGTTVFANNSVPAGYVGASIVAFGNSDLLLPEHGMHTKCSSGVYLGRTPCGKGELLQYDVCVCCPPHTFSFGAANAGSSCTKCPPNAACPGGSFVEPLPGYWSSSPTSIQMHRCPLFKTACNYTNQHHKCQEGYRGPLCGDCRLPEYGMLSPMRCGRCMRPSVQLALFLVLSFAIVVFVWYTVHATWQDNLKGSQEVMATDHIKVLVQFLQYVGIIGSVSVPWSLFDVQQWLQALGVAATVGAGQALSLDCWLYHYFPHPVLPIAIMRLLVYILAPVVTFLLVLALQWLVWAVRHWVLPLVRHQKEGEAVPRTSPMLRKLPVTVLVLGYYSYPTLARVAVTFFACLNIDKPLSALSDIEVPADATAPLSHKWGYWVSDINQECFAGHHLGWSLGLGLPFVLLWCVAVPVAMGVGLRLCKSKANDASFREHFGFLYRTYKPECMWWEAVWVARTVVLTLISVFAFPMQRYFSVLSLLLVFWASAALQLYFRPYAQPTLHHMHLVSTACLAATTLGALAMFAYDIQESTAYPLRIAITVLVFVINLVFVGWCLVKLVPALKGWIAPWYVKAKAWVMDVVHPRPPTGPNRARWRSSRGCCGVC